jgi:predicted glycosyltransferase
MRKPNIVLTDTEHSIKAHTYLTNPFSDVFLTPVVYYNDLGEKQIRFNNIMESLYLHEDFFKPSISVYEYLKIEPETNYVILRFVAWNAFHDVNQKGIDLQTKLQLIKLLEPHYKIFISNEGKIEKELENYELVIPPHMMHDVLNFANLFIGESGTMASECAYLGTPTVYVNSLPLMGYLELEEKHGLLRHFNNTDGLISYVKEQLKNKDNIKKISLNKSGVFKKNFINTTRFLVWFIENYPASFDIMKKNPDYQNEFK